MATWDQGSNSGSFLAGIGLNNSNAPQASDVYATLAQIRQNNEIQRSGANNTGLLALQGLSDNVQAYKEAKAADRQKEFQDAYGKAYAAGDRNALRQLASVYPDQVEAVRNGMKFVDDDQRETVANLSAGARIASSSPDAMEKWIQSNSSDLKRVGIDADEVRKTFQQNPQALGEFADHLGMAAVGPDKYFDIQDKIQGRQIQRDTLAETVRSNQAGEALTARAQNISAQNAALSREIQRAELEDRKLDRQIARETNQIRLADLQQKQMDVREKKEQAKAERTATAQGAVDTFSTALDSLNEIENSPGLAKAVGIKSAFPTIPGTDAANFEARLDTFKAQTFLPMVQSLKGLGALSDAEGKKLSDAVGALSPKMSEKAFRDSIGKIRGQLEGKLSTVKRQFNYQEPPQAQVPQTTQSTTQPGGGYQSLWGD